MASSGSKATVVAAFVGNFIVANAKFVVAGITGSSAMLSEGLPQARNMFVEPESRSG